MYSINVGSSHPVGGYTRLSSISTPNHKYDEVRISQKYDTRFYKCITQ